MVSTRRTRTLIVAAIVTILVIIYVVAGPSATERSAFYQKTLHFTEQRVRNAEAQQQQHEQAPVNIEDERMRQGLRDAESQAKHNADRKFREFEGSNEQVVGVADRKKTPAAEDEPVASLDVSKIYDELVSHAPVTVFSKSYCPFSRKAKHILLDAYEIVPAPYVVELDLHEHGSELQDLLLDKTGRRTVPNVIIKGKSLGGGDDMENLWRTGKLEARFKEAAGGLLKKVVMVKKWGEESQ